jgi:hypothetical protein
MINVGCNRIERDLIGCECFDDLLQLPDVLVPPLALVESERPERWQSRPTDQSVVLLGDLLGRGAHEQVPFEHATDQAELRSALGQNNVHTVGRTNEQTVRGTAVQNLQKEGVRTVPANGGKHAYTKKTVISK